MKLLCVSVGIALCYVLMLFNYTSSQPVDDWLSTYDSETNDDFKRALAKPRSGKRDDIDYDELSKFLAALAKTDDIYSELEEEDDDDNDVSLSERESYKPRSGKRNSEAERPRNGKRSDMEKPRSGKRSEDDRPRAGKRDDRPRAGKRSENDRPRAGKRDDRPRAGKRSEDKRPRAGKRDDRPRAGKRSEFERPRAGKRSEFRPRAGKREGKSQSGKRVALLNIIADEINAIDRPRAGKRELTSRPRAGKRELEGATYDSNEDYNELEMVDNDLWSSM